MDILIQIASYLFLLGILLAVASAFPAVSERVPKLLLWGFLLAAASPFIALLGVVLAD